MPPRPAGRQDRSAVVIGGRAVVGVPGLLDGWLPALPGVPGKLELGATVADVGCRAGDSTIVLARAYPESRFWGFDADPVLMDSARWLAASAGVADQIRFEVSDPGSYPGTSYDLVCQFDRLHALVDPVAVARHVLETLAPDGSWLLVADAAGEPWLREVAARSGFSRFRLAGRVGDDLVLEGKP